MHVKHRKHNNDALLNIITWAYYYKAMDYTECIKEATVIFKYSLQILVIFFLLPQYRWLVPTTLGINQSIDLYHG